MVKKKPKKIKIPKNYIWASQPGPQSYATICPADATFFGGTRGGGKSDCLIGRHIHGVEKYGNHWNGLILRRKFKEFAELRRRWDELIAAGLPAERIGGDQQTNYIRFPKHGNAQIVMTAVQRAEMLDAFQSQQFTEISLEEAPNFPFIDRMIDKLKGSLRSPHGVPCRFFLTGNPGGPGANIIKYMFIKPDPQGLGKPQIDEEGWSSVFIKSTIDDNQILCQNDPGYVKRLKAIKNKALREAWLDGNWDTFVNQAFDFNVERHVIEPIPVPEYAPIYMTFDWGYGAPFSVGWWWADSDGRVYRFSEWYGWNGLPNQGLRLTDTKIAEGIIEREKNLGIHDRVLKRYAPPDCYSKKPSYEKGGQGPPTAEVFGKLGLKLTKIYPDRLLKIKQFRERLFIPDNDMPMMMIYNTCERFIEMIPPLCLDEDKIEDIDTDQEDHIYDEACMICLARPMGVSDDKVEAIAREKAKEVIINKLDNMSRSAWKELDETKKRLDEEYENSVWGLLEGGMW